MNKEEYCDEIALIKEQNNVELEIYPLVSELIAPTLTGLSKRYVFARRLSELGQIYYGISSFPDIAIVDRDFKNEKHKEIKGENWKKLRGCVEVKAYNNLLYNLDTLKKYIDHNSKSSLSKFQLQEVSQLIGEILWYKNVLYTNGVQWKLFKFNSWLEYEKIIIDLVKSRINKTLSDDWWKSKSIKTIFDEKIEEIVISENCSNDWDNFNENIKKLSWGK